ncbi:MAG: beta-lactamase family protein [Candidatus Koribacter versatilis]|uniref:Beta-lactamase family protein n=1 Tax=Candidatus Korobacter versatilis TaxID=658062 RepID=A0A932A7U3_9BACT|nr:beta-lactamase family protein [Candidatus Koribacter versatilis]
MRARQPGFVVILFTAVFLLGPVAAAQEALTAEQRAAIDKAATEALKGSGTPSASVAVVKDGKLAYAHAYGNAKLEPATPATAEMRYAVGSISKQFTATAILMLAEQGKLSLDDKVARFLPNLTRANEVTVRQLLNMTSGYQDYWPQDYVMPNMLKPVTAQQIMEGWARKPLDFEPGAKWQYSNTNYVIAGQIVQKASGQELYSFLMQHVFGPLEMRSVANVDRAPLPATDPTGYRRFALGPLRPAPKEGPGWLDAAGELAMTPSDLARWDVGVIQQRLLKAASYQQQQRATLLNNGVAFPYGLGVSVRAPGGRRTISHTGEVSGFSASNYVYPEDKAAIAVLTNQDAVGTADVIADAIAKALFADTDPATKTATERARQIFLGLEGGKLDRSQFTDNANFYFSAEALHDLQASLGPCGEPKEFAPLGPRGERGGMYARAWRVSCGGQKLRVWTFELPDGKLEQYQVAPLD